MALHIFRFIPFSIPFRFPFRVLIPPGSRDTEWSRFFQIPTFWPWPLTWTIGFIYFLEVFNVSCLATFQERVKRHHFFSKISSSTLTCDLNINNRNLLSIDTHCTKFIHIPAKGSRDNEKKTFFQRPAVWPWPLNIWPGNPYVSSILCRHDPLCYLAAINQRGQEILSRKLYSQKSAEQFCPWPLTRWPENQFGSSTSYGHPLY